MSDARRYPRAPLCVPIGIEGERVRAGVGLTRDASVEGLLIGATRRFEAGERVVLRVVFEPGFREAVVHGRVVRLEEEFGDAAQFFPFRIAVALDTPLAMADVDPSGGERVSDVCIRGA
jgi:hypothetical protein